MYNLSQIYECRNWETEHSNSVLEIHSFISGKTKVGTRYFYIGFLPAFHLQCGGLTDMEKLVSAALHKYRQRCLKTVLEHNLILDYQ